MKGWCAGLLVASIAWLGAIPGLARPVRIGRHVEVPHGVSADHPWVGEDGGAARRGAARYPVPSDAPSVAWEVRVGGGSARTPIVSTKGPLVVATSHTVAGLAPAGEFRWSHRLHLPQGTPALMPELNFLVATRRGDLVRVARDGEVVDRLSVGAGIAAAPLVLDDGSAVVATRDAALVRLDAQGRRMFRTALPQVSRRPPAWDGSRIVVAAGTELHLLSAEGHVRARVAMPELAVAGPAVALDGTLWVLGGKGTLSAFDRHGRVRARADVGRVAASSPLVVGPDGAAYVGTRDGELVCIGPTGTERWRLEGEGVFLAGLSIDPDGVILGTTVQGSLVAVEPDGSVRWRVSTRPRSSSDPVVAADGTVYVGTSAGTVQAFR
ncbi:MAG: PQQ-binding-like beta-propeller repeat protein [Myxococcota bacterium]